MENFAYGRHLQAFRLPLSAMNNLFQPIIENKKKISNTRHEELFRAFRLMKKIYTNERIIEEKKPLRKNGCKRKNNVRDIFISFCKAAGAHSYNQIVESEQSKIGIRSKKK